MANIFYGTDADEIFNGEAGDNIYFSSDGDDNYYGGDGYDQLNYTGYAFQYDFFVESKGDIVIVKPYGSQDYLSNIEGLWFSDEQKWYSLAELAGEVKPLTIIDTPNDDGVFIGSDETFDLMNGTAGEDVFILTEGGDFAQGEGGSDVLHIPGSADDYFIYVNVPKFGPAIVIGETGGRVAFSTTNVNEYYFIGDDQYYGPSGLAALNVSGAYISSGNGRNDILYARGVEDNQFLASTGNDRFNGGWGFDEVAYTGAETDYTFTLDQHGVIYVDKPDGGKDTLMSIESFWFSDQRQWFRFEDVIDKHLIRGTPFDDVLSARDAPFGDDEDNVFEGRAGNDVMRGSTGDDVFDGGDGYDQVNYDGYASDYVFTHQSDGTILVDKPDGSQDTLTSVEGFWFFGEERWYSADQLSAPGQTGTDGADVFYSTAADDAFSGLGGRDVFRAGAGNDSFDGGDDYDQVNYDGYASDYVFTRQDDGGILVSKPDGSQDTLTSVEGFWFFGEEQWYSADQLAAPGQTGTDGADVFYSTAADDAFSGLGGRDVFRAGAGNDSFDGGDDYDQVNYDGSAEDYVFTRQDDGGILVGKPDGSQDTLTSIEGFWFFGEGAWYSADQLAQDVQTSSADLGLEEDMVM